VTRFNAFVFVLATVLAAPAMAQDPDRASDAEDARDRPEDAMPEQTFEPIVVSATRTERNPFTTPAAVSSIDRERIQTIQPYSFLDVFQSIPAVNIFGGPRRIAEEPAIRGFADEQVAIRLDGTRQNFNKAHGGRFLLDPDLLERVEVLRGASSPIYGSGALGGAFVLETVNGRDLTAGVEGLGVRLKGGWQSNGEEFSGYGTLFGQAGDFDFLASAARRDLGEDLSDGSGEDILATRDEIDNGLFKVGFQPGPDQRLEFSYDRFDNTGRNPTNANAPATATNLVDRDTERTSSRLRYQFGSAANRWLDLEAVAYSNEVDVREFRLDDGRIDTTDFETRGLEVFNTSRFGGLADEPIRLTYGFEAYGDEQSGTRRGDDRPQFPDAEVDYRAAYIQAEASLPGDLSLITGLRHDEFEYASAAGFPARDENELSPRVALGWQPIESAYFWAEYAEAFRAPSLTELYADGVHFVVPLGPGQVVINEFVPTPGLEPEQSEQIQLGARFRQRDVFGTGLDLELDGTWYRSDVDNFVDQFVVFIAGEPTFDPITQTLVFPGITTNRNVDAEISGIEASATLRGRSGYLRLAASAIDSEVPGGGELASIQPDNATLAIGVYGLDGQVDVGAELTAARARDDLPEDALATPGYGKTDIYLNYLPRTGALAGFEFRLALDNVFDKDFRIHPNAIDQPGRSFRLTIAREFMVAGF
jgi:hemoglobin/transferrin/lactoferrin receptor protein